MLLFLSCYFLPVISIRSSRYSIIDLYPLVE
jgi:hypothetical protein